MSTGSEAPAGHSTKLARLLMARFRDSNPELVAKDVSEGHPTVEEALKARGTALELSGGSRPDPDRGQLGSALLGSGADLEGRGSLALCPRGGARRARAPSGDND